LVRPEDYHAVAGAEELDARWFAVSDVPDLMYDHQEILAIGIKRLRQKVKLEPIGFNLLPAKFTLTELQKIYEAVLDIKLNKPNFRRKMTRMNLLIDCKEKQSSGGAHRAGQLYRFDADVYRALQKKGFVFEF
jgi:hypothetical protein